MIQIDTSINYVIAAWSGTRRANDTRYYKDRSFYLRNHISRLKSLRTTIIDQYTIVIPENFAEPEGFRDCIPEFINEIPVEIFDRPNAGFSYGSFAEVYASYRINFDYYIWMEDDYMFSLDDFDQLLIKKLLSVKRCGFVCSLFREAHAAIYLGIASSRAMEAIMRKFGKLPHSQSLEYRTNEKEGQVNQSRAFMSCGYRVVDILDKYKVAYRRPEMSIQWFGNLMHPTFVEPI